MEPKLMEAVWEAAESRTIVKSPQWQLVKRYLSKRGVSVDDQMREVVMDQLAKAMKALKEVDLDAEEAEVKKKEIQASEHKAQAKSDKVERGRSKGSRRESDDSGYASERLRQELNERKSAVTFLVPGHPEKDDGEVVLYCLYSDDDDRNYIAPVALKRLTLSEGQDGTVTVSVLIGGHSLPRKFIVQNCTSQGGKFSADVLFGMKPAPESVTEEGPLEEISNKAFDGSQDLSDTQKILQTQDSFQREMLRPLPNDKATTLGTALGIALAHSDEDPQSIGHRAAMATNAAWESISR